MYTTIDLCSGLGFLHKGFDKTGAFKNILSVELDDRLCEVQKANIKNCNVIGGDIRDKSIKNMIHTMDYDMLLAGVNGLSIEIYDEVLRYILTDKPKAFLIEQSMDFVYYDNILEEFVDLFEDDYFIIGTEADGVLYLENIALCAKDYGIADSVRRAYLCGIRKDCLRINDIEFIEFRKENHFDWPKYADTYTWMEDIRGVSFAFNDFKFQKDLSSIEKMQCLYRASPLQLISTIALDIMGFIK